MLHSSCWVYATPKKPGSTISTESYMRKSTPKNWQVASPLVKIGFLQFLGVVSKWLWQTPLKSPSTGRWEIADFVSGEGGSKESHAEHGDVLEWSGTRGPPLKTLTSLVMVGKRSFVFFLMVDGWSLQLGTTTNTSCKWTWWTIQDRIYLLHIAATYCHLPCQLLGQVLSINSSNLWFQISIISLFSMFFLSNRGDDPLVPSAEVFLGETSWNPRN